MSAPTTATTHAGTMERDSWVPLTYVRARRKYIQSAHCVVQSSVLSKPLLDYVTSPCSCLVGTIVGNVGVLGTDPKDDDAIGANGIAGNPGIKLSMGVKEAPGVAVSLTLSHVSRMRATIEL